MIQDILNIRKKHMLISYRREYIADALIELSSNKSKDYKIEFSIEMTPLGTSIVRVKMVDDLDYPLLPLLNELKQRITDMERDKLLPN